MPNIVVMPDLCKDHPKISSKDHMQLATFSVVFHEIKVEHFCKAL